LFTDSSAGRLRPGTHTKGGEHRSPDSRRDYQVGNLAVLAFEQEAGPRQGDPSTFGVKLQYVDVLSPKDIEMHSGPREREGLRQSL